MSTARQKDKATESVTELVGAFKKPPPTPALPPIAGDGAIVSPLPLQTLPVHRRSTEPHQSSRIPNLSGVRAGVRAGVSEHGGEPGAASRSKRSSGFLSLLGYSTITGPGDTTKLMPEEFRNCMRAEFEFFRHG